MAVDPIPRIDPLVQELFKQSELLVFLGDLRGFAHAWNLGRILALFGGLALLLCLLLLPLHLLSLLLLLLLFLLLLLLLMLLRLLRRIHFLAAKAHTPIRLLVHIHLRRVCFVC